jgi:hypothetical protein
VKKFGKSLFWSKNLQEKHFFHGNATIWLDSNLVFRLFYIQNNFSNASNFFLHKLYYNIPQLFLENLITQGNQTFSRGFLTDFVLAL